MVRAQAPASGFEENGRATNRMLYVTAAVLFALAVVALALLVYRDPPAQTLCRSRASRSRLTVSAFPPMSETTADGAQVGR